MMTFIYILAAIIVVIILLWAFAPSKYNIHRSIDIDRPKEEVYQYLKYIKNQDHWSPWQKRDPDMKRIFTGEDGTIGFISRWESDHKQVGSGEQEIVSLKENKRIKSALRFYKPWKSESNGYFDLFGRENGGTKVTWGFYGTNKPPMNIFMLFFNMDKAVGKDFEEGLSELKKVLES